MISSTTKQNKTFLSHGQWLRPVTPALGRWRQNSHELEVKRKRLFLRPGGKGALNTLLCFWRKSSSLPYSILWERNVRKLMVFLKNWETLAQHRLVLELNFALLLPTTELSEEGGVRGD